MKLIIQSADANDNIDPTIREHLLAYLPCVGSLTDADAVIIPISYHPNFQFNESLNKLDRKTIVFDYLEFGWDAGDKENRLGRGIDRPWFSHLESDEWTKLDKWARENPAALTFKRELFEKDRSDSMIPCEWPCRLPVPPLQSEEEFSARPFETFHCFGYSHPSRPRLHGDMFHAMADKGINVLDSFDEYRGQSFNHDRIWISVYTPYYRRKPIEEVMEWQSRAKISVSLPGAGVKCFRHSEAPVGSIMALPSDSLAWAFPWVSGENCVRLDANNLFVCLEAWTKYNHLYDIYVASQENIDRYRSQRYAIEYVLPAIEAVL